MDTRARPALRLRRRNRRAGDDAIAARRTGSTVNRRGWRRGLLAALFVPATSALGADRAFGIASEHLDCRYSTFAPSADSQAAEPSGPLEGVLLPDNDVFRPLLADQRE